MDIINKNSVENPNPKSSNVILLDTAGTSLAESYPNGVYATLTYSAEGTTSSPSLSDATVLGNTAYQDEPFSNQLSSLTTASEQIVIESKKGWMTISVDTDGSDVVYVGASDLLSSNGFKLSSTNPTITVSSDNLSEWFALGDVGGEKLFILGAYLND